MQCSGSVSAQYTVNPTPAAAAAAAATRVSIYILKALTELHFITR